MKTIEEQVNEIIDNRLRCQHSLKHEHLDRKCERERELTCREIQHQPYPLTPLQSNKEYLELKSQLDRIEKTLERIESKP